MELAIRNIFRLKPRRHYIFLPGFLVPRWIYDFEPKLCLDGTPAHGRFMSLAYARRDSEEVKVWSIGLDVGIAVVMADGGTIHGAPTHLFGYFVARACLHRTIGIRVRFR